MCRVTLTLATLILHSAGTHRELSEKFHVGRGTVQVIKSGEWFRQHEKHLPVGGARHKRSMKRVWCPACGSHIFGQCPIHPLETMLPERVYAPQKRGSGLAEYSLVRDQGHRLVLIAR